MTYNDGIRAAAALMPCPFCGGAAHVPNLAGDDVWWVECRSCNVAQLFQHSSKAAAIAAWNTRSTGWRSMDSAPVDATLILAYVPGFGMGRMVLYWSEGYWRNTVDGCGLKIQPTHWQPLPTPPAGE